MNCDEEKDLNVTDEGELEPIHQNKYTRRMLVHQLSLEGLGSTAIAKRTGIPQSTVWRDLQALGRAVEEMDNDFKSLIVLDTAKEIQKAIAEMDSRLALYRLSLYNEKGKLDKDVHRMIQETIEQRGKWVHMFEQSAGRIVAPPTLVQNNTTNTNVVVDAGNPELAALRAQYEEAKRSQATMEQMGKAEAEGMREKEEGVLDVEAVTIPSHPDVLP